MSPVAASDCPPPSERESGPVGETEPHSPMGRGIGVWCLDALWIIVPLVVGVSIPSFYDWTEADQSRPSVWVTGAIFGPLVVAAVASMVVPWWPERWSLLGPRTGQDIPVLRIKIVHLFLITTGVAVLLSGYQVWPQGIAVSVAVTGYIGAVTLFALVPRKRWIVFQLLACQLLPLLWICWDRHLGDPTDRFLGWIGFFPSLLPSIFIGSLVDSKHSPDSPTATLMVGIQLGLCLLAVLSGGPRLTRLALIWTLAIACSSSTILNALVRI